MQLCYQIALQGRDDLPLAPDEHAGFLMTLLRMLAFRPDSGSGEDDAKSNVNAKQRRPKKQRKRQQRSTATGPRWSQRLPLAGGPRSWRAIASSKRSDERRVRAGWCRRSMALPRRRQLPGQAAGGARGAIWRAPVKVRVTSGETRGATAAALEARASAARGSAEATRAVQGDSFVQDLVNLFDGRVVDSTIREKQR